MLINKDREKLLNAIVFFVENTEYCHKIKLYKLLYFLDFQHFQATGRSVTGTDYFAWPKGPVPVGLQNEFQNPSLDMQQALSIEIAQPNGRLDIVPRAEFNSSLFSKRELRILKALCEEFSDAKAADMVEATHVENLPWHQVYEVEQNKQGPIPYSYAIRADEASEVTETIKEHNEFIRNYNDSGDDSI